MCSRLTQARHTEHVAPAHNRICQNRQYSREAAKRDGGKTHAAILGLAGATGKQSPTLLARYRCAGQPNQFFMTGHRRSCSKEVGNGFKESQARQGPERRRSNRMKAGRCPAIWAGPALMEIGFSIAASIVDATAARSSAVSALRPPMATTLVNRRTQENNIICPDTCYLPPPK